jgi:hypothetical protein
MSKVSQRVRVRVLLTYFVDTRPAPKPHFSAPRPAPPKQAPLTMAPPVARRPRASIAPRNAASSMASAAGPSRVPRISAAFHMAEAAPYPSTGKRRESGLGIVRERYNVNKMTDQDINDKVMLRRWA